jgi:Flp pilus assembly protein CpaB
MRTRFSRRRRLGRLVAAAGLALVAGGSAASAVARGNDLARTYGTRTAVVVATHDLDPGSTVTDADLRTVDRPDALVVGTRIDDPRGRTVATRVLAGEVIVGERLAPDGLTGPMALAPAGTRGIAVPTPGGRPPVRPGDRVDVVAVLLDSGRATRTASAGVVVAIDDDAITVAVAPDEVSATARAALDGTAVLALRTD